MKDKVSIITPCYNSARFISKTIESVLNQTYPYWEMIIVDDCSHDNTKEVVEQYCKLDSRIRLLCLEKNSGSATIPRNKAIEEAEGRFIAFIDSDDLWKPEKLERQLPFFNTSNIAVVYSNYEKIDESGNRYGRVILAPKSCTYHQLLCGNVIGCSTGVYDTLKTGKHFFVSEGHEDYILWLSILKKGYLAVNTQSCLAEYRIRKSSLSSNKIKVLPWVWNIYMNIEKIGYFRSAFYFINYAFRGIFKYIK